MLKRVLGLLLYCPEGRIWFYPDMTDTQKRVDNHHLTEVSHVPEKTLLT